MDELSKENTEMEAENKKMQKTIETLKVGGWGKGGWLDQS